VKGEIGIGRLACAALLLAGCSAGQNSGVGPASSQPSATGSTLVVVSTAAAQTTVAPSTIQPPEATTAPASASGAWIAYQQGSGITLVHPDGSSPHLFAVEGSRPHHPDWSPDGTRLAYVTNEADGTSDIWVAALDGSGQRKVIDCVAPCLFAEDPTWSPDGSKIAYWTNSSDSQVQQIHIADAATGTTVAIVDTGPLTGPVSPKFSPDGRRLLLEVGTFQPAGSDFTLVSSEIAIADLTSTAPKVTTITHGMLAGYPDWSPDGSEIVFQAGNVDPFTHTGKVPELYTIHADGTGLRQITHHKDGDPWPALPDWGVDPSSPLLVSAITSGTDYWLAKVDPDSGTITPIGGSPGAVSGAHPRRSPQP
jgi:Tol biopolymer transport system component